MIWTLRIQGTWGPFLEEEWLRVIEIDSSACLYELHDAIQDAVGFDRDHLFEFTAGRHQRHRKIIFAEDAYDSGWDDIFVSNMDIALEEVYPLPKGMQLFYHFDFGDDWYFKIMRSRKKPREPEPGVKYPRVVERVGDNPAQYDD